MVLQEISSGFKSSNIFVEATDDSLVVWCMPKAAPRTPEFESATLAKFELSYKRHPERRTTPGFYRLYRGRLVACDRPRRLTEAPLANCENLGSLDVFVKDVLAGKAGDALGLLSSAVQWGTPSAVTILSLPKKRHQLGAAVPVEWFGLALSLGAKDFSVGTDDGLVQVDFSGSSVKGSLWSQPMMHPIAFFRPRTISECGPLTGSVKDPDGHVLLSGASGASVTVSSEQYSSLQRYGRSGWSLSAGSNMALLSRQDVSVALSTLVAL